MIDKTKKSTKCNFDGCNKKLKLSDMECRCEKRFCLIHRLPEQHKCSINYKNINPINLEKCIGEKVIRI